MTHRRQFIAHLASTAMVVAGSRLAAFQAAAHHREVRVGGRRVKTVDVHAHIFIPGVVDVVRGTALERPATASATGPLVLSDARLKRWTSRASTSRC